MCFKIWKSVNRNYLLYRISNYRHLQFIATRHKLLYKKQWRYIWYKQGKAFPLQARTGPCGSRRFRFQNF